MGIDARRAPLQASHARRVEANEPSLCGGLAEELRIPGQRVLIDGGKCRVRLDHGIL